MVTVVSLSSEELRVRQQERRPSQTLRFSCLPLIPISYLLKQLHSVSGGESRRGWGAGTPVVMAGGRDAVY